MSITVEIVKDALSKIIDPNTGKDFISSKSAKNIALDGNDVALDIELGYPGKSQIELIRSLVSDAISKLDGIGKLHVHPPLQSISRWRWLLRVPM